jgi:DNA polymerase
VAAQQLIAPDFKVTQRHGEFIEKNGVFFMGTYHPAALLRNPNNKPEAFADLLKLRDRLALG